MAIGDFDGDGIDDVLTVGSGKKSVLLLITDESIGKPGTPVTVAQGTDILDVTAADVNADGKTDVVIADYGVSSLVVLPGNGDGTFAAPITSAMAVSPVNAVTADFNGDGRIDVAFRAPAAIVVASGNGNGGFTETHRAASPVAAYDLVVADFNGDTHADLLVPQWELTSMQLLRGNGSGTLAAPTQITLPYATHAYAAGDLDNDGDLDLAVAQRMSHWLAILRNDGTGAFTSFGEYDTLPANYYYGEVFGIGVADVTQDGVLDLVLAQANDRVLATLTGKGDGTFDAPLFTIAAIAGWKTNPTKVFLSDFDGDGRIDVLFTAFDDIAIALNHCGDTGVTAKVTTPLISAGDAALVDVSVGPTWSYVELPAWPFPTGTMTIFEGETPVTTGTTGAEPISIPGLSVGTHTLRAVYGGDDRYRGATSTTFTVRVTTDTTTTTLVPDKAVYKYSDSISLTAGVSASNGGTPPHRYRFIVNGIPDQYISSSPLHMVYASVGEHTFQVQYLGDSNYPPSISAPLKVRVEKAPSAVSLSGSPGAMTRLGETANYPFEFSSSAFYEPAATVELYDGATRIATTTVTSGYAKFSLSLSLGRHILTAKFLGNANYLPSELKIEHTVVQNLPLVVDAIASGTTIRIDWLTPDVPKTTLQRLVNNAWTEVPGVSWSARQHFEPNATPGVLYTYRVQSFDWNNALIATSNIDIALVTAFSDDPLTPKVTRVKAVHLTQIIAAANILRAAVALGPISVPNAASGKPIKSADALAIRGGIQNARALLGLSSYPFTNILSAGAPIRAVDVQELRDAVR